MKRILMALVVLIGLSSYGMAKGFRYFCIGTSITDLTTNVKIKFTEKQQEKFGAYFTIYPTKLKLKSGKDKWTYVYTQDNSDVYKNAKSGFFTTVPSNINGTEKYIYTGAVKDNKMIVNFCLFIKSVK